MTTSRPYRTNTSLGTPSCRAQVGAVDMRFKHVEISALSRHIRRKRFTDQGSDPPELQILAMASIEPTLQHIRGQRIVHSMIFVELTPFGAFRAEHWSDDDLRRLQNLLLARPDAGNVIRGSHGLRKLRWSASGRGKRGGARVIYYWHVPGERIYLIYAYAKNVQDDLTREQIKILAELMKDIVNG